MANKHHLHVISATSPDHGGVEREEGQPILTLGQWVMVADEEKTWNQGRKDYNITPYEWLGCIMGLGTNYVEIAHPSDPRYRPGTTRIHMDEVWTRLSFLSEEEAQAVISGNIAKYQERSAKLIANVKDITQRLGLKTAGALPDRSHDPGTSLATLSSQQNVNDYKNALVVAKEKTLPELFEGIEKANVEITRWMTANTLPMRAMAGDMTEHVEKIQDRIFSISLYAGLVESVVKCCDGAPADMTAKLHVMQRRCYMDEECLANYRSGGMSFKEIGEFDDWLSEPENRDRILPFPRTIVALRVRRTTAEREWDGSLMSAYINIRLAELDGATFLYVRNGEQIWRLSTDIEFGHMIFPDKAIYDPSEPMMVKMFAGRIDTMMARREYEDRLAEHEQINAAWKTWNLNNPLSDWLAANPDKQHGQWEYANPYWSKTDSFRPNEWKPLDSSNVFFDDAMEKIGEEIKRYNRIATIIQGLFDRSEVLHPHLPVQTWSPEGFERAIKLVYDVTHVLHSGEAPDFETYRQECNASIGVGSVVTGQDIYWMEREAEKEMARRQKDWRLSDGERYRELRRFQPYGNPGPAVVGTVEEWKPRARTGLFSWTRERRGWPRDAVACSIWVPADALFNVSAYKPGDFKRFYQDSRTRAQYLKWAPLLLAAEDYHAGQPKKDRRVGQ